MYSHAMPREFPACSGCGLCRLVCPMWRRRRDPRFSPEGLAKALQHGATAAELAAPLDACSLCGACDPVCPERIDLTGMIMDLRCALPQKEIGDRPQFHESRNRGLSPISVSPISGGLSPISVISHPISQTPAGALLLPGAALRADPALLARVGGLLGIAVAADDGADIALVLETGGEIDPVRRRRFLDGIEGRTVVIGDGLLLRQLRRWLPPARLQGLGEALGNVGAIRRRLASADFYIIEARAYHADYERLVGHYDRLRADTGCAMNLDLQRIAIPAADEAEARWMLQGRRPARIVVENPAEREILRRVADVPVLHLAELAAA